jgi:hypothetical protein
MSTGRLRCWTAWLGPLLLRCLRPAAHIAASLFATSGLVVLTVYVTATSHSVWVFFVSLLGLTSGVVGWHIAGRLPRRVWRGGRRTVLNRRRQRKAARRRERDQDGAEHDRSLSVTIECSSRVVRPCSR